MNNNNNHALHQQADVDRLFFQRSEGGIGLMSVEDSIKSEINSLSRDVESCHGSLVGGGVQRKKNSKMLF